MSEKKIKYETTDFHNEISSDYDNMLNGSIPANAIRSYFQKRVLENIKNGEHLLEVGCGTGTDAISLAKNGIQVTATDISPKMLIITQSKAEKNGVSDLIKTEILDADNLSSFKGRTYDGVISNLNAVNYVKDIKSFSISISTVLKPGGKIFFVMLNKICIWEIFYNLLKLKPVIAFKRLISREKDFKTEMRLYFPRKIKKIFSKQFDVNKIIGFGFLYPPDGLSPFQKRHEMLFDKIKPLEKFLCSKYPFYNFCDHYLIEMTKK